MPSTAALAPLARTLADRCGVEARDAGCTVPKTTTSPSSRGWRLQAKTEETRFLRATRPALRRRVTKILVVDDDQACLHYLREFLGQAGHDVVTASKAGL